MLRSLVAGLLAGLALALALVLPAMADEASPWHWSGYGSLALQRADGEGFRLRPDPSVARALPPGDWRLDGDSRLGLQLRRSLGESSELVVQTEISDDIERRWRPRLVWAYVGVPLGDDWRLRLGRQTLPTLRFSETRTVGYAQPGVRPPLPVYNQNPGQPIDGLNLSWEGAAADGTLNLDIGIGRSGVQRPQVRVDVRQIAALALQWRREDWLLRGSASHSRYDLTPHPLAPLAASGQCLNCAALLVDQARGRGIRSLQFSALLLWEPGAWEWSLELLERPRANSALSPAVRAWSLTGAWRSGALQPHVAVGQLRFREPLLGLQPTSAAAAGLIGSFERLLAQAGHDLRVVQAGLRWDLGSQLALKLQHERWQALGDRGAGRSGVLEIAAPPLAPGPSRWNGVAALSTLSLDFVF